MYNAEKIRVKAGRAYKDKKYKEAIRLYRIITGRSYFQAAGNLEVLNALADSYANAELYENALQVSYKISEYRNTYHAALSLERIGYIKVLKGFYDEALEPFSESLNYFREYDPKNINAIANLYINLGSVYGFMKDFRKSLESYSQALSLYSNAGLYQNPKTVYLLNNIGAAYARLSRIISSKKKLYELKALANYKEALKIHKRVSVKDTLISAKVYANLATFYSKNNRFKTARQYYDKALNAYKLTTGKTSLEISKIYSNMGGFYKKAKQYNKAALIIRKSILIKKNFPKPNVLSAIDYKNLAGIAYLQKDFAKALTYIQRSLHELAGLSEDVNAYNILLYPDLLLILKEKDAILQKLYKAQNKAGHLELRLKNFLFILELVDRYKTGFKNLESKEILSLDTYSVFEDAIETACKLYDKTGNVSYIETAFMFSEKFKAYSLLENIRQRDALKKAGVPEKLIEKERYLLKNISFYEKLLLDEKRKARKSRINIAVIEDNLLKYREELDLLIREIEKNYYSYSRLKRKIDVVPLKALQKSLRRDTVFIEYFTGSRNIYAFKVTSVNIELFRIKNEICLQKQVKKFKSLISGFNGANLKISAIDSIGKILYNKLLAGCVVLKPHVNRLIIVPDESLGYIPFEILGNVKDNAYLLQRFSVSYSYSASILYETDDTRASAGNKFLGFAPSFHYSDIKKRADEAEKVRSALVPLKWSTRELKNAKKFFPGKLFEGKKATKKNFEEAAHAYSIIHFATHGLIDDANPMFSRIALARSMGPVDESYLYAYELYNLKLNAKLAVLSACNTGYGKLVKGEGVMNIARGFTYAGCRSIVMSLWQVNDRSTAEIMKHFYKYLAGGKEIDEALRLAKLEYLKKADKIHSHPFFWAPFIIIGSRKAI